jgi:hypothetical protein
VTDYMLEYRSSFPDRLTDSTLHHRQKISSRVHPVSYLIHTTDKSDHLSPHSAQVSLA